GRRPEIGGGSTNSTEHRRGAALRAHSRRGLPRAGRAGLVAWPAARTTRFRWDRRVARPRRPGDPGATEPRLQRLDGPGASVVQSHDADLLGYRLLRGAHAGRTADASLQAPTARTPRHRGEPLDRPGVRRTSAH